MCKLPIIISFALLCSTHVQLHGSTPIQSFISELLPGNLRFQRLLRAEIPFSSKWLIRHSFLKTVRSSLKGRYFNIYILLLLLKKKTKQLLGAAELLYKKLCLSVYHHLSLLRSYLH